MKKLLSIVLSLIICGSLVGNFGLKASAANVYSVAGDAAICGIAWDPSINQMVLTENHDYAITFASIPAGTYSFKITDGTWNNTWGAEDGSAYSITLSDASKVSIYFNPSTAAITVDAANLVATSKTIHTANITANGGADSADIKGTYVAGTESAKVFNADITWGCMEFTFTDASNGTWNPATVSYEGGTPAAWSCTANANKITVSNRSNVPIIAGLSFTADASHSDVTAKFCTDAALTQDVTELDLYEASAYDTTSGTVSAGVRTSSAYLGITGGALTGGSNVKVGSVTVTISEQTGY